MIWKEKKMSTPDPFHKWRHVVHRPQIQCLQILRFCANLAILKVLRAKICICGLRFSCDFEVFAILLSKYQPMTSQKGHFCPFCDVTILTLEKVLFSVAIFLRFLAFLLRFLSPTIWRHWEFSTFRESRVIRPIVLYIFHLWYWFVCDKYILSYLFICVFLCVFVFD